MLLEWVYREDGQACQPESNVDRGRERGELERDADDGHTLL